MTFEWHTPAWQTPIDKADRVELLCLPKKEIITELDWPEAFWQNVSQRYFLPELEAQRVIGLFRDLAVGEPARCHMPPWGLALYEHETLLFTVTLCYLCHNAYVYTARGKDLRAFDPVHPSAVALRQLLQRYLLVDE